MREFALIGAILSLVFAFVTAFTFFKKNDRAAMVAGFLSFVLGATSVIVSAVVLLKVMM